MKTMVKKFRTIEDDHVDTHGSWAISYGDLLTVLLSFFILFFSTDFTKTKKEEFNSSLIDAFKEKKNDIYSTVSKQMFTKVDENSFLNIKEINRDNFLVFYKGLSFFDPGQTSPRIETLPILKKFVENIQPFLGEYKIIIQAYTDSRPVTSNKHRFKDNVELSALRSVAVKRQLKVLGIDPGRIEITGRGVLGPNILAFMDVESQDKETISKLQRTISFIIKRDSLEKGKDK